MLRREEALQLLHEHGVTESLLQHALASEAVMRAVAKHLQENEDVWAMTGLLHDLDYPATAEQPDLHGKRGAELLAGQLPEEACKAIEAHNAEYTGRQPQSRFDYALRCCETVTGIISAAARLRPTGYEGMEVKSVKKKMKDKAFAASVNRETIKECVKADMELDDFLRLAISAMASMPQQ